jgi:hypothetical protein
MRGDRPEDLNNLSTSQMLLELAMLTADMSRVFGGRYEKEIRADTNL